MRNLHCALVAVALLVWAGAAAADPIPLELDTEDRDVRKDVVELVRRARLETERLLSIRTDDPGTLRVYATWNDWAVAERRLTRGAFASNGAFTTHANGDAHLAIQPELSEELLSELGLPQLTRRLIAHEASHVVVMSGAEAPERHPDWLSEGIACVVADRALRVHDDLESDPTASTRLFRCRRMLEDGRLPRLEEVLDDRLDAYERGERYALWWAVGHHLVEHAPDALRAAVGVADQGTRAVADAVRESVGEGLVELDNEFAAWIEASQPRWHEETRAATVTDDSIVQSSFSTESLLWDLREPAPRGSLSGRVEVPAGRGDSGWTALWLLSDDERIEVRVTRGFGVTVTRGAASGDGPRDTVVSHPHRGVAGARPTEVRLQWERDGLVLRVAGRRVAELADVAPLRRIAFRTAPYTTARWTRLRFQ